MKTTLSVSRRGAITLPAKLRKALGIQGEDLLLAETYTQERLDEFGAAENELETWYDNNG